MVEVTQELGVHVVMEEIETHDDAVGGLGNSIISRETCFNSLHTSSLGRNLILRDLTWVSLARNLTRLDGRFNEHIEEIISVEKLDAVQVGVLSLHVILDYYDAAKLQNLSKKTVILTTLYQSSGQARGKEGFLNVTDMGGDQVAFGSAVAGSSLNSNLVKSVTSQPYNISVLQVSSPIMPESVTKTNTRTSTPQPAEAPAPSKAKSAAPASDMAPAPADADSPTADHRRNLLPQMQILQPHPTMDGPTAADPPEADSHSGGESVNGEQELALLWLRWFCHQSGV
ncbi:hypothetical protein GH714_028524 [Hevea brasiliensis]|uniref:Uncharacterized protein n=1 Tax=Hevea brasiliensis TaxID=3981 RepID=A0A6A6LN26_HEVBR|nr:hypothetical protein GH714_028524 [Hevea brasiliensis]